MQSLPEMPLPCDGLDFNGDGQVDPADLVPVAKAWHNLSQYGPRYDVGLGGPDGLILIDDLQRVGGCQGTQAAGVYDPLLIRAGDDLFESPAGQSFVTVPVTTPIPSGFFGMKSGTPSDPVSGTISLQGLPLTNTTPTGSQEFQPHGQFGELALLARHGVLATSQGTGRPDTLVRRLSDATLGDIGGTTAPSATIPIEIVALSLVSVQPIQVTYGGGNPSFFDVFVDLPPSTQSTGAMTISRTGAFSGTLMSTLPVNSRVTFVNRAGPSGTDQPQGPLNRFDVFYNGMGTGSPLGPGYDTGTAVPWLVNPSLPGGDTPAARSGGAALTSPQAITPTVSVQPYSQTVSEGQVFTVSLVVSDVTNLGAFEFTLAYSPTLVQALTATLSAPSILGSTGRTVGVPPSAPIISNTLGTITFGAYSYGAQPGVNGNGVLAIVTLQARAAGTSSLTLLNATSNPLELMDPPGNLLTVQSVSGQVKIRRQVYLPLIERN